MSGTLIFNLKKGHDQDSPAVPHTGYVFKALTLIHQGNDLTQDGFSFTW